MSLAAQGVIGQVFMELSGGAPELFPRSSLPLKMVMMEEQEVGDGTLGQRAWGGH